MLPRPPPALAKVKRLVSRSLITFLATRLVPESPLPSEVSPKPMIVSGRPTEGLLSAISIGLTGGAPLRRTNAMSSGRSGSLGFQPECRTYCEAGYCLPSSVKKVCLSPGVMQWAAVSSVCLPISVAVQRLTSACGLLMSPV